MTQGDWLLAFADAAAHEAMLFAAIGFAIGGFDDFLVDSLYLFRRAGLWARGIGTPTLADLPPPDRTGRIAVFVPAWDESAVIGAMLNTAGARFDHPDWRIYVGTYPNDRATIDAVAAVAECEPRIRLVIGDAPGPTTKAHCLNTLWHALLADEVGDTTGTLAVVLHDAEDVAHRHELAVYARLLGRGADVVQLPVLPLLDRQSRLVAGHYADEFCESHAKQMLVRQTLGAAMPLAGVGCAIDRDMLGRIASLRGGAPFDPDSLTEDYELGLMIGRLGGRAAFARVAESPGGPPVAVRAYFPARIDAAIRQKARWMTGIALAGWDRTGWGRMMALGDHWMRMRDRRAILSVLVLAVAYLALVGWAALAAIHWWRGDAGQPIGPALSWLLGVNAGFLAWRIAMRVAFVAAAYGRVEAIWSIPRMVVANYIALLAARRAMFRYVGLLRGAKLEWDKTAHHFPDPRQMPE
ncbi:glycosyl transferase family protein [Sphingomonas sp.]|uniref:glycosyl transferase family protein n=1 Tax=Sphingomonas sp. TaxID=28214 RepID=UPI002C780ED3|nr:glycosyl transferase family protein [Sphingomonas sp.]HTG39272.1 glycosyl transferase family protein [Sphingomonas sp.]